MEKTTQVVTMTPELCTALAARLPDILARVYSHLAPDFGRGEDSYALIPGYEGVSGVIPVEVAGVPLGRFIAMWVPEGADPLANLRDMLGWAMTQVADDSEEWFGNARLTAQ
jgi:hypothetical protein